MNTAAMVKEIIIDTLRLSSDLEIDEETELLKSIPELKSENRALLIQALEETFGIELEEDEISEDIFDTFGVLCEFVSHKL